MKKPQFEYLEVNFPTDNKPARALNEYGQNGWQIVFISRGNWFTNVIFMREVRNIPTNTAKQNIGKKPGSTTTRF